MENIIETVKKFHRGSVHKFVCASEKAVPTNDGKRVLTKVSTLFCRAGIAYPHLKANEGMGECSGESTRYVWRDKYECESKTNGNTYLVLYPMPNNKSLRAHVTYLLDGVEMTREQLSERGIAKSHYEPRAGEAPKFLTILPDNILAVK